MPGRLRERLGPLQERRFRLRFAATTVTTVGDAVAAIVVAFAVLDLPGASATQLGVVLAARSASNAAVVLVGGSSPIACRATSSWPAPR